MGVILVVAITVALSGVVGVFVFDIGQSTDQSSQFKPAVTMQEKTDGVYIQVMTEGASNGTLHILQNGEAIKSVTDPNAGYALRIGNLSDGDTVSVTYGSGSSESLVQSLSTKSAIGGDSVTVISGESTDTVGTAIYGDGSDGELVRSTDGTENGIINATTYTLESGVTRTVDNGVLIIHATEKVTINGTLRSVGASGGSGGVHTCGAGNPGSDGGAADYIAAGGAGGVYSGGNGADGSFAGGAGSGGQGGYSGGAAGGDGGDGGAATSSVPSETQTTTISGDSYLESESGWSEFYTLNVVAGAGGAGGGAGGEGESGGCNYIGDGGAGGDGGGLIVIIAPQVEITSTGVVSSDGFDGAPGQSSSGTQGDAGGAGGGGGGGAAGLVYIISEDTANSGAVTAAGGASASGGAGSSNGHDGGNGASGRDGEIHFITVE